MRLKVAIAALGVLLLLALVTARSVAWVPDDDMQPSLYAGDLVVLWPGDAAPGDVVAVADPIAPGRWTLRRVLAVEGFVRYEDGFYHTDTEEPVVLDMGTLGSDRVLQEGDYLTQRETRGVRWEMAPVAVPKGRVWLAADNRDGAVDSRWWGPAPVATVQGTVVLRVGDPRHAWRGWISTQP